MRKFWNRGAILVLALLVVVVLAFSIARQTALGGAREDVRATGMAGPAHYSVVMTEGNNLLVTDNATNKLYFYTTDKDKPIGSPLKLCASVDLTKVGQDEIQITPHNLEKADK